jgi:hypothetical protein
MNKVSRVYVELDSEKGWIIEHETFPCAVSRKIITTEIKVKDETFTRRISLEKEFEQIFMFHNTHDKIKFGVWCSEVDIETFTDRMKSRTAVFVLNEFSKFKKFLNYI